ncbi:hypothetical protein FSP39_023552 [Pinctada imbricata]|uniref:Transcription initiation factor IIF subunit alpha n=1 Tax=Pinctada imbricata TaxID=66713 RepID=A0AA89BV05_PINIB|nr:hypothetical protein FSP39_023552 [Pinctada imbricata]
MMKFATGADVDFVKLSQTPVRMERENNLKEYKSAYDIDLMPKYGAGSEYGREQKEEARRKKYGIQIKKYNPEDQPYIMKIGKGKEAKKMKGVREGTITDNTSYYIFTQCADNAFEAIPIEEWYTFSPMIRYKYLNSEEAEEEFNRLRDKTMNLFSVMVRNRVRNEEDKEGGTEEEEKVKAKSKVKKKASDSFFLTEDDELDLDEDDDDDGDDDDNEDSKPKSKGKNKKVAGKSRRTAKHNSDDEAVEESDEGDFDDKEVDYITDSSSEEELEDREKKDTYEEKGVAEEHGLRKLIDSEDESEEEEKKSDKEEEEGEGGENKDKKEKKKDGSDSSSSSSSDSDSDIEKDETLVSAIFMQKQKADRKSPVPDKGASGDSEERKASKRKLESEESSAKKVRTESPSLGASDNSGCHTEDAIRRYLMRKPMTAKEILAKFSNKRLNMTKEQMIATVGSLLKKINPEKKNIHNKMYFMLKKPE